VGGLPLGDDGQAVNVPAARLLVVELSNVISGVAAHLRSLVDHDDPACARVPPVRAPALDLRRARLVAKKAQANLLGNR
jgi:hypothetical protein